MRCLFPAGLMVFLCLPGFVSADLRSREQADTTPDMGLPREIAGRSANPLSAFFGLDNSRPIKANRICLGTTGVDGMPVIFSTEIDHDMLQAGDFRVTKGSGAVLQSGLSK